MKLIVGRKPFARGVTHLEYVGDNEAVEKATRGSEGPVHLAVEGAAIGGVVGTLVGRPIAGALLGAGLVLALFGGTYGCLYDALTAKR